MNVFLDTNVLLDVLARREPFYGAAAAIWTLAEQGKDRGPVHGLISAISFTNIYYIVCKVRDRRTARQALVLLHATFTPVACDGRILQLALDADFPDFEDAVQYHSALRARADCLITRDPHHFPASGLKVLAPAEFLAMRSGT
jgi:predicted nucleic acid-binding protein